MGYVVVVSERIGNEYNRNKYSGIIHDNEKDAYAELYKASEYYKKDPYAVCYVMEVQKK